MRPGSHSRSSVPCGRYGIHTELLTELVVEERTATATAQAFSLFSIIIDRLQDEVRPFAGGILHLLPEVWSDSEGQSLMRIQVRPLSKDVLQRTHPSMRLTCMSDTAPTH